MLFLVIAYDGTDAEAPGRRQAVRPQHVEGSGAAHASGFLQYAGALLDEAGGMIGSLLVVEAGDADEVQAYVDNDVYSRSGVWQRVEIHPFKRAF